MRSHVPAQDLAVSGERPGLRRFLCGAVGTAQHLSFNKVFSFFSFCRLFFLCAARKRKDAQGRQFCEVAQLAPQKQLKCKKPQSCIRLRSRGFAWRFPPPPPALFFLLLCKTKDKKKKSRRPTARAQCLFTAGPAQPPPAAQCACAGDVVAPGKPRLLLRPGTRECGAEVWDGAVCTGEPGDLKGKERRPQVGVASPS